LYDLDIVTRYWFSSYRILRDADIRCGTEASHPAWAMCDSMAAAKMKSMFPVVTSMYKSFDTGPYPLKLEGARLSRGPTEWLTVDRMSARRSEDVTDFPVYHFPHRPHHPTSF
jgi:hypothetical protein